MDASSPVPKHAVHACIPSNSTLYSVATQLTSIARGKSLSAKRSWAKTFYHADTNTSTDAATRTKSITVRRIAEDFSLAAIVVKAFALIVELQSPAAMRRVQANAVQSFHVVTIAVIRLVILGFHVLHASNHVRKAVPMAVAKAHAVTIAIRV